MKTKLNYLYVLASLLMLVPSCNKSETENPVPSPEITQNLVPMTFTATMEGSATKTTLGDDWSVSWAEGDAVKFVWEIYDGTTHTPGNSVSSDVTIDSSGEASFTADVNEDFSKAESEYEARHLYAVYPASTAVSYYEDGSDASLYITIPDELTVTSGEDSFAKASIATAKWASPDTPLQFKNLCGLLQIVISDENVRKIEISSDVDIAGKMSVTFPKTGDNTGLPVEKEFSNGNTSITLNVPGADTYYVAVRPGDITNFYVSLYDSEGELIGNKATDNTLSVARKQIRKMGTILTGFSDRFYVKVGGTGSGTSWDDAAPYSALSTQFTANTSKKYYFAAGDYTASQISAGTGTSSVMNTILGGYPADASGHDISGRDWQNNVVVLDANSANRIWILQRGTWVIDGITFKNAVRGSSSSDIGSALCFEGNAAASFTLKNCTFQGNSSATSKGGGAIRVSNTTVNMTNCKFFANTANGPGGAIHVNANATLNATNCVFGDSDDSSLANTVSGTNTGACIYTIGVTNLKGCSFLKNSANYRGGSVCMDAGAKLTIDGCIFSGNTAQIGGALYVNKITSAATLNVNNTLFSDNTATSNGGGAVGISGDSKTYTGLLEFTKCKFDGNSATVAAGCGGAVWDNGAGASFTDCSFTSNRCTTAAASENATGGGAVFCNMSSTANRLFFDRCFFANNTVPDEKWGHHICVASTSALLGINNCVIRAPWGVTRSDTSYKGIGALVMSRTNTVISNTTIYGRVGNVMVTQGAADSNGFTVVNSIVVNAAGTPNCFYTYEDVKYIKLYSTLYTQIKSGSYNFTADANSLSGVTYGDLGWVRDGNGTSYSVDDIRDHIYYYPWEGSIDGKTFGKPSLTEVQTAISSTTNVGSAFLSWLGEDNLAVDIRGKARNTSAMWPGSYEVYSAGASAPSFNVR